MVDIEQQARRGEEESYEYEIAPNKAIERPPDFSASSISNYIKTRIPTLFTPPSSNLSNVNPMPAFRAMRRSHWNWFFLGLLGWVMDAMDYFVVSSAATEIAETLGVTVTDITWGMTLVLMLRSVGAVIMGVSADRIGRKWPYIACCFMFMVLEIGLGFVQTYKQFLGVRAVFGIAMGGMYGTAAATALENLPDESRSVLAGLIPAGYSFGFLLAIVFYRAFQFSYKAGEGWRALCWFSAGPPFILLVWRLCFGEGPYFEQLKESRKYAKKSNIGVWKEAKDAFKNYWLIFTYLVLMMAGFNFLSHGTQDLYATYLVNQAHFNPDEKTVTMVVFNLGSCLGGLVWGQLNELTGRRLAIFTGLIWVGIFCYPAFMVPSIGVIIPCSFFLQFGVTASWAAAAIHLIELSPPAYRALASGLAYQLGNLASSASSTIESTIGSRFPIEGEPGVYNYGKVMAIFTACVILYMMIIVLIGPERFHRQLEQVPGYEEEKLDGIEHVVHEDKETTDHIEHR